MTTIDSLVLDEQGLRPLRQLVTMIVRQELDRHMRSDPSVEQSPTHKLSNREREILTLIANGYARNDISESLGLRYNTVCTHISNIYSKLSISTIAEATQIAIRAGLA